MLITGDNALSPRLGVGAGISLLAHVAAALLLIQYPDHQGLTDAPDQARERDRQTPPPREERVQLGIEESKAVTISWLGFEEPTPHEAPKAPTEQAALARAASAPAPVPAPPTPEPAPSAQPAAESEPRSEPEPEQRAEQVSAEDPAKALTLEAAETEREAEPLPKPVDKSAELVRMPAEAIREVEASAESTQGTEASDSERTEAAAESQPQDQPTSALRPTQPREPTEEAAEADAEPGEASDRASDPTSIEEPIDVRIGKPAAAEGLKIKTVRPEVSTTTRVLSSPRPAMIRIVFRADGDVDHAEYVRDERGRKLDTGSPKWDEAVLYAVYRWQASGERLERLREQRGDDAMLTILMRGYAR